MPPKAQTSEKRAPSPYSSDFATDNVTQKDEVSAAVTANITVDKPLLELGHLAAALTETAGMKTDDRAGTAAPSFHGNFDLYAMELPFLNSKFTPTCDYAAFLKVLRSYQAKPDNSAQIYLPDDFSTGTPGRLRSLPIEDPMEGMPHKVALKSLALKDSVRFTAREVTEDVFYSEPSTGAAIPGVTATVALAHHHCGVFMTKGTFKMRRAWVSADGKDEVFEGFFSIYIVYSRLYRRRIWEDSLKVRLPFWGIRARVGPDGKEIGLGPAGGEDD
ncbi:hypothetical protein LXA43DRAFT_1058440 [Ganoderma leucocontextum]|nr:hypothetical protein LXA43DRAFT_1058440 [Ganoderma leucocontextum]